MKLHHLGVGVDRRQPGRVRARGATARGAAAPCRRALSPWAARLRRAGERLGAGERRRHASGLAAPRSRRKRGTARGRGEARALARPALGRPPSLSRPAGGDLGGRPRMGRLSVRPRRAGRCTGVTQTCARGADPPGRRLRGVRPTCRRCGCSVLGAVGACRAVAAGDGAAAGSSTKPCDVASPSVANASAVSTASRTSAANERFCGRRDAVSGGNMCSESYDRGRTETAKSGVANPLRKRPIWLCAAPPERVFCNRSCRAAGLRLSGSRASTRCRPWCGSSRPPRR